jgi:rhamnulokinase
VTKAAGLRDDAPRGVIVRCVLDSLAKTCARVVADLAELTREPVTRIHVVGGGARNALLNRLIEEACGVPVTTGSTEATALGNALVQGIALGRYASLEEARAGL